MPSPNGYVLQVDGYEIRPSWPAPFYALCLDDADEPAEPLLIHCESLEHAQAHRGIVLDAEFNRVEKS